MCAVDGGATVYETVELPPDKFDRHGNINFFKPNQKRNALGEEYDYIFDVTTQAVDRNITIFRFENKIVRRADDKLLGRQVSYARRGGDIAGLGHPSSFGCPEFRDGDILENIFIKTLGTGGV